MRHAGPAKCMAGPHGADSTAARWAHTHTLRFRLWFDPPAWAGGRTWPAACRPRTGSTACGRAGRKQAVAAHRYRQGSAAACSKGAVRRPSAATSRKNTPCRCKPGAGRFDVGGVPSCQLPRRRRFLSPAGCARCSRCVAPASTRRRLHGWSTSTRLQQLSMAWGHKGRLAGRTLARSPAPPLRSSAASSTGALAPSITCQAAAAPTGDEQQQRAAGHGCLVGGPGLLIVST